MGRGPGGLFWKVFAACWFTAVLTGVGINVIARLFPAFIELPPTPPSVEQSVLLPALTGGLIAAALSAALAWSLSKPLRLLSQAFSAAAAGQLDMRIMHRLGQQRDEFADLARDYDSMAQQLQSLLGAQRRLLHDVSHELRSPLARLQIAAGLLQQSPDGVVQAVKRIEREVHRLDQLVGEVLTLARLESGVSLGPPNEIDVIGLLTSVADDARFEARAQDKDLRSEASHATLLIRGHGELLLRAFENVVRNAVKYTARGSCVEVQTRVHRTELVVRVLDRSADVSAVTVQHMFEPFVRGENNTQIAGFGLGLAIARRSMQAHGGDITADVREGGGLMLVMTLELTHFGGRFPV